jgi:hypothetical protein
MFIFRYQHLTMYCCLAIIGLIADAAVTAASYTWRGLPSVPN